MDANCVLIASTPTRDNADVNSIAFIKAFFEDFPGPIASRAADYTKIFDNKGFDSKESLKGILTPDQVEKWKIPEGHAIQIVQQILLLFAPVVLPVFAPVGGAHRLSRLRLTSGPRSLLNLRMRLCRLLIPRVRLAHVKSSISLCKA